MWECFFAKHEKELQKILNDKFIWYRDVFIAELKETLFRKIERMQELETLKYILPEQDVKDNIATIFAGSVYMYFRFLYNKQKHECFETSLRTAIFLFIRNYAYGGMFRYSKSGDFNVPYGGIGYNSKSLERKIAYYRSAELLAHFERTKIYSLDFLDFLRSAHPTANDFIFLDPPYDTTFSTYAQNEFSSGDQIRLADYLCGECKAKWMMIIKNTPLVYSLYEKRGVSLYSFNKKYQVSFMNRNDKNAEHLLIRNY